MLVLAIRVPNNKHKKYGLMASLVFQSTKKENITNHIMSYVVLLYERETIHLSITYSEVVMNSLLVVQFLDIR